MAPRVDQAPQKHAEFQRFGTKLPDSPGIQTTHAPRSLNVTVNINRLIHVQKTVVTPSQRVQDVMRVFCAKARQDDAA